MKRSYTYIKDLTSRRKSQPKKRKKAKKIQKKSRKALVDNPFVRQQATTKDMYTDKTRDGVIQLSYSRMAALKHASKMSGLDTASSNNLTFKDRFCVPPIPGASNWVQLGPTSIPYGQTNSPSSSVLVTGRVTSIVINRINPQVIYLGTAQGGIWKTTDGGRNWIAMSDYENSLAIGALVIDPRIDPKGNDILYAGTGEGNLLFSDPDILQQSYYGCGILKTTNGGKDWKNYGGDENTGPLSGARFFRLAINPVDPSIIFAATSYGLYRSIDNGEGWNEIAIDLLSGISNKLPATDVVINPSNPDIVYAAFLRHGIFKTANANAQVPKWERLSNKFPSSGLLRIALGISPSSPDNLYALISNEGAVIDKFLWTSDAGVSWAPIPLPGFSYDRNYPSSIGPQGDYNINVAVDPTTPDTVYLSGIILWKAVRERETNKWTVTPIGNDIHTDNHAFAFDPINHLAIYAGTDGGIFRSYDGGDTWDDTINEGLCITQFGYMDQHPTSDALVLGGTQDNGTLQFRNSPAFYFSAYGDGGFVVIDPDEPSTLVHQYIHTRLYHSKRAGNIHSWDLINDGIEQDYEESLFYAPFTLDQSNSKNIAFGSYRIFLDADQGRGNWKASQPIVLSDLNRNSQNTDARGPEVVSAICYINSDPGLIYAGTSYGKLFRITKNGTQWVAKPIHSSPLPPLFIWDISPAPDNVNKITVVMAGVGSTDKPLVHVWRGNITDQGLATWNDISGNGNGRLPDTPVNCLAIDPNLPKTIYIGTDVGVFKTDNDGDTWSRFSQGLPNCPVFDLRLHSPSQLLRAATHGRGMWEIKLDVQTMPDIYLYVRNHSMDTGRFPSSTSSTATAAFENPFPSPYTKNQLFNVNLGEGLSWDMCPDIKVDPPFYDYKNPDDVDYIKFESQLLHRDLQRGRINHIYVQVHNRGIKAAGLPPSNFKVSIKLLYADVSHGYPPLPEDFWRQLSENTFDNSVWKVIDQTRFLPSPPKTLTNTEPTVLEWDWNPGSDVPDIIGLLVVLDSPEDPIPEPSKNIFNIESLVTTERRVGLRRLNVVNV
jgi:photosystem II stability/assembly factor-like uncharacterized protein